ncbi:neuronal acetylcholine receptor subunit non-alpha-2-like isoform X2 [Periplaneta americana]|uniref:neuronal acetylcholine receptor subunit non-alpha-2-like isoform X2 n=1 Tax=Periplaneta americana TaxID=6978 RepID=UPI0037E9300E
MCFQGVTAEDFCRVSSPKSQTLRLKRDLLCNYDKTIRPVVDNGNATFVYITMLLRSLTYEWLDEHLLWKPSEYEDLKQVLVESEKIWIPDIVHYGSSAWESFNKVENTRCLVYFNGMVTCVPRMVYSTLCDLDLTYWPFDRINCSVRAGSLSRLAGEITVDNDYGHVNLANYEDNRVWKLLSATSVVREQDYGVNFTYRWIEYNFAMFRYSVKEEVIAVVPALAIVILVSLSCWLSPLENKRIHISCFTLVFHCLYLQYMGGVLGNTGDVTPVAVQLQRNSLILLALSLVVAIFLRCLSLSSIEPPTWIRGLTKRLLSYRMGQLILLMKITKASTIAKEEGANDEAVLIETSETDNATTWSLLGTLLDRVLFTICVIFYVFIFIRWNT